MKKKCSRAEQETFTGVRTVQTCMGVFRKKRNKAVYCGRGVCDSKKYHMSIIRREKEALKSQRKK